MTQESFKIFSNSKSKQRETVFEHGVDSRDVFVESYGSAFADFSCILK